MNWKKGLLFSSLGIVIFMIDGLLKAYAHYCIPLMSSSSYVYPYDGIAVFQGWAGIDFCLTHVINRGAAWGVFANIQHVLLYARIAIIGGLLTYLFCVKGDVFRKFCLMLVAAGACGNVADYFIYGHVVDMFYFVFWGYSYPVFNLADSAIFCGIALLLGQSAWSTLQERFKAKSIG
jgi:signal peptidase II